MDKHTTKNVALGHARFAARTLVRARRNLARREAMFERAADALATESGEVVDHNLLLNDAAHDLDAEGE